MPKREDSCEEGQTLAVKPEDLARGARLALYGAGVFGSEALSLLRRERPDIEVVCFFDTFKSGELDGVPVILAKDFPAHRDRFDQVLITSGAIGPILSTLQGFGESGCLLPDISFRQQAKTAKSRKYFKAFETLAAGTRIAVHGAEPDVSHLVAYIAAKRPDLAAVARDVDSDWLAGPRENADLIIAIAPRTEEGFASFRGFDAENCYFFDPLLLDLSAKLQGEIGVQLDIWKHGYQEGDPLDPAGGSNYATMGWISSLHVTYLTCVKPYVDSGSTILEIGCGRGAWTKSFFTRNPAEVWCMDVVPAESLGIYDHLGPERKIRFVQATDFSCRGLPDNHFNYLFSYGCLCHISFEGIAEYLKNLYPKLRRGAHGFIQVADYEKFNRGTKEHSQKVADLFPPHLREKALALAAHVDHPVADFNEDDQPQPGRWYQCGVERACALLAGLSYTVVEPDMVVNLRDPVIHFRKD